MELVCEEFSKLSGFECNFSLIKRIKEFEVDNYDAFIAINYTYNDYETKNISQEMRIKLGKATEKSSDIRINQSEKRKCL